MLKSFVPLRVKGDHSFGRAVGSPSELVAHAVSLGIRAMALTDVGSLAAQVEFHATCRAAGIEPITGVELDVRAANADAGCLVLLAENELGYARLCRIVTARAARGGAAASGSAEEMDLTGVFALTDSPALAARLVEHGNERSRVALLLGRPSPDGTREGALRETAARLGVRLVADLDVVMPAESDAALLSLSGAVHTRRQRASAPPRRSPGFLHRSAEALFADAPESVRATREIA